MIFFLIFRVFLGSFIERLLFIVSSSFFSGSAQAYLYASIPNKEGKKEIEAAEQA